MVDRDDKPDKPDKPFDDPCHPANVLYPVMRPCRATYGAPEIPETEDSRVTAALEGVPWWDVHEINKALSRAGFTWGDPLIDHLKRFDSLTEAQIREKMGSEDWDEERRQGVEESFARVKAEYAKRQDDG